MNLKERNFEQELDFTATRSSGPGGQNVNKVNSRVVLRFNIAETRLLVESEKEIIYSKLSKRISKEGILQITSQIKRSQLENKEIAIERFYQLLENALKPVRKRTPTRPTKASKIKRLESKQINSRRKALRKTIPDAE
jgi:ribosome-associated protein